VAKIEAIVKEESWEWASSYCTHVQVFRVKLTMPFDAAIAVLRQ